MSFNPLVSAWFAAQAPHIVRGLVVSEEDKSGFKGRIERMLSHWRARPEFLAYDVRDLPSIFADRARRRGLPEIGRANVCTPVTTVPLVCRLQRSKNNKQN